MKHLFHLLRAVWNKSGFFTVRVTEFPMIRSLLAGYAPIKFPWP